jgi:hypothetical protein
MLNAKRSKAFRDIGVLETMLRFAFSIEHLALTVAAQS